MSASYHLPIGRLHWLHFGLSHGFVTTASGPSKDLPFNKRFFPGGDNSIRGYQFGEAAPRDQNHDLVGGESYMLGNIEFEQGITKSLSFVAFVDALGNARSISDYPFNEGLYSVGGGLRWKTLIGPARLEYGYNLHRREEDLPACRPGRRARDAPAARAPRGGRPAAGQDRPGEGASSCRAQVPCTSSARLSASGRWP